jgi:hypothetical protein
MRAGSPRPYCPDRHHLPEPVAGQRDLQLQRLILVCDSRDRQLLLPGHEAREAREEIDRALDEKA